MTENPYADSRGTGKTRASHTSPLYSSACLLLCISGLLLFATSLILPAIKYGKITHGIECLGLTVVAFTPASPYSTTTNLLVWMSRAAVLAHTSCVVISACVFLKIKLNRVAGRILSGLVMSICFLFLLPINYGAELRYTGYYVWLASLIMISTSIHITEPTFLRIWSPAEESGIANTRPDR